MYKLAGQTLLGLFVGLTLWLSPDAVIRENVSTQRLGNTEVVVHKSEKVKSTITTIPFVKDNNLDYAEIMSFCGKYKTFSCVIYIDWFNGRNCCFLWCNSNICYYEYIY